MPEDWVYYVEGVEYQGLRIWRCESPGPIGCGVTFRVTESELLFDETQNCWVQLVDAWEPIPEAEYLAFRASQGLPPE